MQNEVYRWLKVSTFMNFWNESTKVIVLEFKCVKAYFRVLLSSLNASNSLLETEHSLLYNNPFGTIKGRMFLFKLMGILFVYELNICLMTSRWMTKELSTISFGSITLWAKSIFCLNFGYWAISYATNFIFDLIK